MRRWAAARTVALAAALVLIVTGCAELNRTITGRDLACADADTTQCIAMADAAVRALDPATASSVTRIELADTQCGGEIWWDGEEVPADVDRCWEVMAMTADGWRRGIVIRFDGGRLHVAW
jgi:hypothetical protein